MTHFSFATLWNILLCLNECYKLSSVCASQMRNLISPDLRYYGSFSECWLTGIGQIYTVLNFHCRPERWTSHVPTQPSFPAYRSWGRGGRPLHLQQPLQLSHNQKILLQCKLWWKNQYLCWNGMMSRFRSTSLLGIFFHNMLEKSKNAGVTFTKLWLISSLSELQLWWKTKDCAFQI